MLRRTQTYIAMFSMMGAGVFASVEAAEYSPVIHAEVSQVDWSKGLHNLAVTADSRRREDALKKLLKDPDFQKLPSEWQEAVIKNVDNFYLDGKYGKSYLFSSMLRVREVHSKIVALPLDLQAIRGWIGLPQPEEPLNPKTGKPYVRVPKSLVADLTPTEILYVKKVLKVINQNLHYLNSLPSTMDPKKLEQGDYIGYAFMPLTLVQPKVLYEDYPSPDKNGMRKKSHQDLVDMFAEGDEELYRLQSQVGTPFYNMQLLTAYYGFGREDLDCYGFSASSFYGIRPIILSFADMFKNSLYLQAYKIYYEETKKSFPILRTGLAAEVESRADQPKLHKVLTHIQAQTEPYLKKMEQAADYMLKKTSPSSYVTIPEPKYQDILKISDRLLDVRVSKGEDVPEKTEKELTPKEKRLLKKQQRQGEKELKKQQRQRS